MSNLTIVTGASRGLGFELAKQSLRKGDFVITLERKVQSNNPLTALSKEIGCDLMQIEVDLLDLRGVVNMLSWALNDEKFQSVDCVNLINNAGVLGPVGPIEKNDPTAIVDCIRINFEAPVIVTQTVLKITENWKAQKRILNISSGAARKAVPGWAMYCSTKAALDRFSSVVRADETRLGRDVRISSTAPGVVDTGMQQQIRNSEPADFPQIDRFLKLKANQELVSAEDTAKKLLTYLNSADFGNEAITDIRTLTIKE